MPHSTSAETLARRERQIMDAVHQLGAASVSDVRARLQDPPSYSAVRTMLRHLEGKGLLTHQQDGKRYVYRAVESRRSASRSALKKLLKVFFGGSATDAVAAILDVSQKLEQADLDRLEALIHKARTEGK